MQDAHPHPLLFPAPRRVEYLGAWVDLPAGADPKVRETRLTQSLDERTIAAQAYTLEVRDPAADGILFHLTTASPAGRRMALATAQQLLTQYPVRLPLLRITDEPAFATRAVMLDISRNRVPTLAEAQRIATDLAALKINHLQLYTEHTFAYTGHESAWSDASPFTAEEIRTLDAHCAELGIALTANQNCFGHLAHWLRLSLYTHLAETHGAWIFDVWPRTGPFSLCPIDPASLDFVRDLLTQLLPNFSSPLVNIGCDETFDVGAGRSAAAVAQRGGGPRGRALLYAEFVSSICAIAADLGKRPMFWADIALSHPEVLASLPRALLALAWGYEPTSPFEQWGAALRADHREFWVCPGTSSWRSITGRTREREGNLAAAAAAGIAHGATGMLICDWGDTGHHQTWPIALHGLARAAAAAWQGSPSSADTAASADHHTHALAAESLHVFSDPDLRAAQWLDTLGDADEPLRRVAGRLSRPDQPGEFALQNQSALFADLHNCALTERTNVGDPELWKDAAGRIEDAWVDMPQNLDPLITAEFEHTIATARLAARRAISRRTPGGLPPAESLTLADMTAALRADHELLWPRRARPGGLLASSAHYTRIELDLRTHAAALSAPAPAPAEPRA
ncbi:hypothetical protein BH11PLA1_BH11PLA1_15330 [soil metagenome]